MNTSPSNINYNSSNHNFRNITYCDGNRDPRLQQKASNDSFSLKSRDPRLQSLNNTALGFIPHNNNICHTPTVSTINSSSQNQYSQISYTSSIPVNTNGIQKSMLYNYNHYSPQFYPQSYLPTPLHSMVGSYNNSDNNKSYSNNDKYSGITRVQNNGGNLKLQQPNYCHASSSYASSNCTNDRLDDEFAVGIKYLNEVDYSTFGSRQNINNGSQNVNDPIISNSFYNNFFRQEEYDEQQQDSYILNKLRNVKSSHDNDYVDIDQIKCVYKSNKFQKNSQQIKKNKCISSCVANNQKTREKFGNQKSCSNKPWFKSRKYIQTKNKKNFLFIKNNQKQKINNYNNHLSALNLKNAPIKKHQPNKNKYSYESKKFHSNTGNYDNKNWHAVDVKKHSFNPQYKFNRYIQIPKKKNYVLHNGKNYSNVKLNEHEISTCDMNGPRANISCTSSELNLSNDDCLSSQDVNDNVKKNNLLKTNKYNNGEPVSVTGICKYKNKLNSTLSADVPVSVTVPTVSSNENSTIKCNSNIVNDYVLPNTALTAASTISTTTSVKINSDCVVGNVSNDVTCMSLSTAVNDIEKDQFAEININEIEYKKMANTDNITSSSSLSSNDSNVENLIHTMILQLISLLQTFSETKGSKRIQEILTMLRTESNCMQCNKNCGEIDTMGLKISTENASDKTNIAEANKCNIILNEVRKFCTNIVDDGKLTELNNNAVKLSMIEKQQNIFTDSKQFSQKTSKLIKKGNRELAQLHANIKELSKTEKNNIFTIGYTRSCRNNKLLKCTLNDYINKLPD